MIPETERPLSSVPVAGLASESDAAVLASLGYKQELRRNFSRIEVFGIAFSIMSIVPSIATSLVYSIPAGPVGIVWGWFIPGMFIFIVALAMADLGSAMPTAGGLYWWTHYFASPKTRNALCFLVGYSNSIGLIGGFCSGIYAVALMLLSVIVIARDGQWTPSNGEIYLVYMGCILCHAVLASLLSKIAGKLQTVFVIGNMLLFLATIVAFPIGRGSERNGTRFMFTQTANMTDWPIGWTFVLAWMAPIWVIGAFDSCVHISEEASNATLAVPHGIVIAVCGCWLLGWLLCIVVAACINPDLESVLSTPFGQPMAQIYYDALGKNGALVFMALVTVLLFAICQSILIAASRQTWAFSRDGALPCSRYFSRISVRFGYIPLRTIWGCAVVGLVLGLLCLIAPAAAVALFSLVVASNNLAWLIPIFCRVFWGQGKFKPGPFYTGRFSVPIAWFAISFLVFGIVLSMFPVRGPHPAPDTMNYTVVINSAVWIGSLLYYFIDARK